MEGFRNHMAIDGSLKGISVKDVACGWAVVQLDYDKEEEQWYATYGTRLAELYVQRTIKRAQLVAFTMALSELVGPSTVHTDNMGIMDGLWRGEEGCVGPKTIRCDLWLQFLFFFGSWDVDVKHVKARS